MTVKVVVIRLVCWRILVLLSIFLKLFECHSNFNELLFKQLSDKVYDQAFTVY